MQLCRGCLAALTELEQVAVENLLVSRLVGRVVYANGCPDGRQSAWIPSSLVSPSRRKREQAGNKKDDLFCA